MATKLSVNLNKVATLRNTRHIGIPSVTRAATLSIRAGAHGITLHPRPDQRHIRPDDVRDIGELISQHPSVEFNIEGNPFHGLIEYAEKYRPTQCTLVPDDETQSTSDHGWDLRKDSERLKPIVQRLQGYGCRVSLFMDPAIEGISLAAALGVDRVELYTEPYASAPPSDRAGVLQTFRDAALAARAHSLGVNAGHDLSLLNLGAFLAAVPEVQEVSIGHALIADALEFGLPVTVARYLAVVAGA